MHSELVTLAHAHRDGTHHLRVPAPEIATDLRQVRHWDGCDGVAWKPRFSATVERCRSGLQLAVVCLRMTDGPRASALAHWSKSIAPPDASWVSLTLFTHTKV